METTFFDGSDVNEEILKGQSIPDGSYRVIMTECIKEDSRRDSRIKMFACKFTVIEGVENGSHFMQRFLFAHPTSEIAANLGKAKFKLLCQALSGKDVIKSAADIQNKCCYVEVKNVVNKQGYENLEIKKMSGKRFGENETLKDDLPF